MELNGQKVSDPGARLATLLSKREKIQGELQNVEKQVYELETSYLQESNHFCHVSKGFEGLLSTSKPATNLKRPRKFLPEDRIFSLSSATSPAVEEQHAGRRDDFGAGRSKAGGLPSNGPGKPKKTKLVS